jgi:hypothetical protein
MVAAESDQQGRGIEEHEQETQSELSHLDFFDHVPDGHLISRVPRWSALHVLARLRRELPLRSGRVRVRSGPLADGLPEKYRGRTTLSPWAVCAAPQTGRTKRSQATVWVAPDATERDAVLDDIAELIADAVWLDLERSEDESQTAPNSTSRTHKEK